MVFGEDDHPVGCRVAGHEQSLQWLIRGTEEKGMVEKEGQRPWVWR